MNKTSGMARLTFQRPIRSVAPLPLARSNDDRLRDYLLSREGIDNDAQVDLLIRSYTIVNNAKKKLGIL